MDKKLVAKAVKIAKEIFPPNGKITYETIKTKDNGFYARISLSGVEPYHIEFNESVFDRYFADNNITEKHQQLIFLIRVTLHEFCHSRTHNVIKHKPTDEMICEFIERIFIGTLDNIHKIECKE